ncbi:MAG: PilC/PilY family type IV pilus protein [Candidatus Aminicenantales bacterium]
MRYPVIKTAFAGALLALFVLAGGPASVSAQTCTENTGSVSETFSNGTNLDLAASSAKFWYNDASNPRGIMTLHKLGANFSIANPSSVPAWINALSTNDFDLDGWPDYIGTSSSYSNALAFVKNMGSSGTVGTFDITLWIDGSTGNASDWPTKGVGGAALDTEGHCGMASGDYDGDGDMDFLYVASTTAGGNAFKRIWLYKNALITNGVNTGVLNFVQTDLTSAWTSTLKGIAWSATQMVSIDLDGDGDLDIVFGNREGNIFKITNTGNHLINAQTFIVESTPIVATGFGGCGVNTISVADFDGDPGLDIIAGSVSTADLNFYKNDGTGQFTLVATFTDTTGNLHNNMYDGAATVSLAADFDEDGDQDLIIGTDNWNYLSSDSGYGGKCYYFRNDGAANFTVSLIYDGPTKFPAVEDFDLGAVFDFDKDGDLDFLIADGNDSRYYYVFVNSSADVYNLSGFGYSTNLTPGLLGSQYAITKARLTAIDQTVIGGSSTGLSVNYYLSNDNGASWEYYADFSGSNITSKTNQPWHEFHTFGSKLRWKAVLAATDDGIPAYPNSSYETPSIDRLAFEYVYVERREYSRSSAAAAAIVSGTRRKLIISASFMFPGYEGQLRAYDVTDIALASTGGSTIQTISTADPLSPTGRNVTTGGTILWDAGQLLQARDQSNRTIYAGYKSGSTYSRVDFTVANVNTLKSLLRDSNGDNAGLIRVIRGENRPWKLGDILHSSPVLVGPPSGDATALGTSYAAFVTANAGRTPVIFVGANDGMLHCFDLSTGAELWGFIPYNLLPKLKNMSAWDSVAGVRYYAHDYFVDGTPTVGDVYFGGKWRTVLMCGQGAGKGSTTAGGLNYYFALDVTDPTNPLVLWEAKDLATMGETWSVPAFGQVLSGSTYYWVAFVGSGYDNDTSRTVGNRFYIIRLDTGAILKTLTVTADVNTSLSSKCPNPYPNIQVTVPGSPAAIDTNRDGRTEYVYFGDLDGRFYRLPLTSSNTSNWTLATIYTDRMKYPIITKPAVFLDPTSGGLPLGIYFGTGGDDAAPSDRKYAFIEMKDTGSSASVEWYIGDATETGLSSSLKVAEMGTGEKVWSDPVISDKIVYFSSLMGSIENVNPCLNLAQQGRLYARFVQTVAGSVIGSSALKSAGGSAVESLQLASKARKAVTVGELQAGGGSSSKKEVYIQEYDSTIERLEQPVGSLLRVVTWREIYKIIK